MKWDAELYQALHGLARQRLGSAHTNPTLGATALVHEVFLRLNSPSRPREDQREYLALASYAIRSVIVDHIRKRNAEKRGGGANTCPLDEWACVYEERAGDLASLDAALMRLEQVDERLAEIVNLRFFGGLSEEQIAELLGVSTRTIRRDWQLARAWLRTAIESN